MKIHPVFIPLLALLLLSPLATADDWPQEKPHNQLGLASQYQGIFQSRLLCNLEQNDNSGEVSYPTYKSEGTAFLIALVPGFFIHGLGHMYAGDGLTGILLLGTGAISGYIFCGAAIATAFQENGYEHNLAAYFAIGGIGFLGTWLYDFIHAPVAVRNYNEKVRAQIIFRGEKNKEIGIKLTFSF